MNYGQKIAEFRKSANLTQAELGAKLNITAQAVSKWENSLSEPDIDSIRKMCEIFNVSVDEFLGVSVKKEVEKTPNQSKNIEKTSPLSWSGTLVFESSYQKQGTFATQPQERYVLSQKKRAPLPKEEIRQKD